ncbi:MULTISPECIES: tetratricopeptide repeat protein [unclassified Microcoleus]|uniref:tetratricopeptide repeat protein n=1 Tax=unclassified Microcoleus TaxID=2642155 RepID=UPI001DA692A6|nr:MULTISPECIES: tetratricopeptide repeat protein [unclassified Microcoleus]MCC3473876.1 tetratricopeptide repeat protein [Microcoleus sp. PH2017_13_LAR_U_A]MCC3486313.1 tetratricopeptide repeat protein [Microcoleus sp. PH2017_14_LAR_D_A]MCC3523765.1 tetratricopeptide repeat protein [Microcoleus sp. PH2017_20_SFW_D_A]MCC3598847.1 tetratricopeptide repeat protein [Microcoleus sp. PH2017_26_ELK_O_A]MCC3623849.1 tetratricopeptide repeat protein [Microcoleus sp. PH2017_36_ELK_O_B]
MLNDFRNVQIHGEDPVTITGLISIGNNAKIQGKYQEATQNYFEILELAFQTANQQAKAIAFAGLGSILTCCHQYEMALEYYQQQLNAAKKINDILWEADAICSLGYIHYLLKNYDDAIKLQDKCLDIANIIQNTELKARGLRCLGMIDCELQEYKTAIDFYRQSIDIYQDNKLQLEEAETLVYVAIAEREAKLSQTVGKLRLVDLESVIYNLYNASSISDTLGDNALNAKALKELAITYELTGEMEIARSKCNSALKAAIKIQNHYLINECQEMIKRYTNYETEQEEYSIEDQNWYSPSFPQKTEGIDEKECQELKENTDVVIITATSVELKAVLKLFDPYPDQEKILRVYVKSGTYYCGKLGCYNTIVTKCRMGAVDDGASTLATNQALDMWNPKAVIMVGIAFGKCTTEQKIGDVLVASEIIFYERQRQGKEIESRGSIPPSDGTLLNRFENAYEWQFSLPNGKLSTIIPGAILSGEKLVDDPEFKAVLFKRFPQAKGGEMEGSGLCAAARESRTPWILVKSICDWGDGTKHKKHQPLAAAAAANLVHYVLSQPYVLDSIKKP